MKLRTLFIIILPLLNGLTGTVHAELSQQQVLSLFDQANTAFREANTATEDTARQALYQKAILTFERIIQEGGIHNAELYYNLANAYLLNEDIGRAILNYRRAQWLDSRGANIHKNLSFARTQRLDKVVIQSEKRVQRTLFFWHYDFSLHTRLRLCCIFFGLLCTGLTVIIWRGRHSGLSAVVIISGILLLCILGSVLVETLVQNNVAEGVIIASSVMARQGDGQNYPPSFKDPLHAGTEFELLEQRPDWLHIQLEDGSDGWISDNAAELI
jgi:hypothetical protein